MTTTETILFLFAGVHGAALIWLCCERDRMSKKIKELELK